MPIMRPKRIIKKKFNFTFSNSALYGKRRGSVAAATNKVVKAAGKNNSTTSVPGFIPQIPKPVHALSQLIQGGALTVRAENGLGQTTNNTEKTSSTRVPVSVSPIKGPAHAASLSQLIQDRGMKWKMDWGHPPTTQGEPHQHHLPVSDQRRTILSEAGLNRIVARIKHTTERFNGADLMSNGGVDNSHKPLHSELGDASLTFSSAAFLSSTPLKDRLSTPPRTAAPITRNLGQLPQEIINFMAESNAKQERLMSIVTTLATQKTTQAVPQDEADVMIDSLELLFNDFEEFLSFDQKLKNSSGFRNKFVNYLACMGGGSLKESCKFILFHTKDKYVSLRYSRQGMGRLKKLPFEKTEFCKCLKRVLGIRHPEKNGFQLRPMQEAITNFLKDAKDRKGGRQMRNRKKENVAENSSSSSSSSSSKDDD
ncbi:Uncharacterized protein APZ42_033800 [Daphnia magna]|uniref:DUF4806 domain-containing protein n=1 Tax=Daphnia magna TaxID=35525 RepID=A0A164KQB8_9CRUS|nr:Uncharacterized protein APZ42_033800 [Daphnia magna]